MKNDNKSGDKILDLIKKITKENTYIKISIYFTKKKRTFVGYSGCVFI